MYTYCSSPQNPMGFTDWAENPFLREVNSIFYCPFLYNLSSFMGNSSFAY